MTTPSFDNIGCLVVTRDQQLAESKARLQQEQRAKEEAVSAAASATSAAKSVGLQLQTERELKAGLERACERQKREIATLQARLADADAELEV